MGKTPGLEAGQDLQGVETLPVTLRCTHLCALAECSLSGPRGFFHSLLCRPYILPTRGKIAIDLAFPFPKWQLLYL